MRTFLNNIVYCIWSSGPRQPRQGLNQRPRGAAVITQQNGIDVISSSQHDVTYLAAPEQPNNHLEIKQPPHSPLEINSEKSELSLLDCHQQQQQQQRLLVSSDTSGSNGTAAWISSQGHLVTVWTPSGTPLSTGRDQDNNQQQQNSMNLINARIHIRRNPSTVDGCGEAKIAETKT